MAVTELTRPHLTTHLFCIKLQNKLFLRKNKTQRRTDQTASPSCFFAETLFRRKNNAFVKKRPKIAVSWGSV